MNTPRTKLFKCLLIGILALLALITCEINTADNGVDVTRDLNSILSKWHGSTAHDAAVMLRSTTRNSATAIGTVAQLKAIGATGIYYLTADIDLSGEHNWTPLHNTTPFSGTLHGDGYAIYNLSINSTDGNVGLFSTLNDATVENLAIVIKSVLGRTNVGALAGTVTGASTLNNLVVAGMDLNSTVSGNMDNIGGLVGNMKLGTLVGHNVGVNVFSANYTGGLIGITDNSTITGTSTGNITGKRSVGGLVGFVSTTKLPYTDSVTGSASGIITGYSIVGGLVGTYMGATSMSGMFSGHITCKFDSCGGLVGHTTRDVTGAFSGTVSNNSTTEVIEQSTGGLLGSSKGTLTGYSLGWVVINAIQDNHIGTLVGSGTATNGYYNSLYNGNTVDRVGNSDSGTRNASNTNVVGMGTAIAGVAEATTTNMSKLTKASDPVNLASDVGKWVFVADKWPKLVLPISVTDMLDLEMTDVNQPASYFD